MERLDYLVYLSTRLTELSKKADNLDKNDPQYVLRVSEIKGAMEELKEMGYWLESHELSWR
jgi:hypothetical protein